MEGFKNRLVQIASAQIAAFILQGLIAGNLAKFQIRGMGGLDHIKVLGIDQVQAVAQINDSTQNGR